MQLLRFIKEMSEACVCQCEPPFIKMNLWKSRLQFFVWFLLSQIVTFINRLLLFELQYHNKDEKLFYSWHFYNKLKAAGKEQHFFPSENGVHRWDSVEIPLLLANRGEVWVRTTFCSAFEAVLTRNRKQRFETQ